MKAIVIAAGECKRLRPLTNETPKCMLKINGKSVLKRMVDLFSENGISDISVVRGYKKEKINLSGITYFDNTDFRNNNILHSLMFSREKLEEALNSGEDVVISYSDIIYSEEILKFLMTSRKPITSVVDTDWHGYYEGRSDHPAEEAENVIIDEEKRIVKIGKQIFTHDTPKEMQGEFIGLWKFTPEGIKTFLNYFNRLNSLLKMTDSYQSAKEWQKSYITDIFQEMISQGEQIHCVLIKQGWKEFDTIQDFEKIGGES